MLLKLFGCEFKEGRSALAPTLRSGKGDTKGELLKVSIGASVPADVLNPDNKRSGEKKRWADVEDDTEDKILWNGNWYPKAINNDGTTNHDLPDALHNTYSLLPHLHPELDAHFPCAQACSPLPETVPEEGNPLEERGRRLGFGLEVPAVDRVDGGGGCMVVGDDSWSASCQRAGPESKDCCVELNCKDVLPALIQKPKVKIWEWMDFEGKQDLVQLHRRSRSWQGAGRAQQLGARRSRGRSSRQ